MRVACPPIISPCFYGVDFPTKQELVANNKTLAEIRDFLHVDTLGYISLEGLLGCASLPPDHYCTACWSGDYKIPVDKMLNTFRIRPCQTPLFEDLDSYHV